MNSQKYKIRTILQKDNAVIEKIIRDCLIEFGANHEGTAWCDPNLGRFSEIYGTKGNQYWVAENEHGELVGGVGVGELPGADGVCELQKMYCIPEVRGTGASHQLMDTALEYAKHYYHTVYLETTEQMVAAKKFYEKYGFSWTPDRVGDTGHPGCDVCYIKKIK